jgi:hypothetical protein
MRFLRSKAAEAAVQDAREQKERAIALRQQAEADLPEAQQVTRRLREMTAANGFDKLLLAPWRGEPT